MCSVASVLHSLLTCLCMRRRLGVEEGVGGGFCNGPPPPPRHLATSPIITSLQVCRWWTGECYEVTDAILERLDRLEGKEPPRPPPRPVRRIQPTIDMTCTHTRTLTPHPRHVPDRPS